MGNVDAGALKQRKHRIKIKMTETKGQELHDFIFSKQRN
jgi:hypothetical protein